MHQRAFRKKRWYVDSCLVASSPADATMRLTVGRPMHSTHPTATVTNVSRVGAVKQAAKLKSSTWNAETVAIGFTAVLR